MLVVVLHIYFLCKKCTSCLEKLSLLNPKHCYILLYLFTQFNNPSSLNDAVMMKCSSTLYNSTKKTFIKYLYNSTGEGYVCSRAVESYGLSLLHAKAQHEESLLGLKSKNRFRYLHQMTRSTGGEGCCSLGIVNRGGEKSELFDISGLQQSAIQTNASLSVSDVDSTTQTHTIRLSDLKITVIEHTVGWVLLTVLEMFGRVCKRHCQANCFIALTQPPKHRHGTLFVIWDRE